MNEVVLSETTQAIVNVVFGICFGAVICLIALASRNLRGGTSISVGAGIGTGLSRKRVLDAAREGRELGQSRWGLILATYGLVGVMIAAVQFSPVSMRWWWFFGSLMAVMMIAQSSFRSAAKRGDTRDSGLGQDEPAPDSHDA